MQKRRPHNYKGRRKYNRIIICICLALTIGSIAFVVWHLETIADFLRGGFQTSLENPPVDDGQDTDGDGDNPVPEPLDTLGGPESIEQMAGVYLLGETCETAADIVNFAAWAKSMGVNTLVVDVKDSAGAVQFLTTLTYSFMPDVTKDGAFSLEETVAALKAEGFYLVARMSCFEDNIAPRRNVSMAIQTSGVTWLDWDYSSWLNPYSNLSREYLGDLAAYFCQIGFDEILLNSVEFPVRGKTELIQYSAEQSQPENKKEALNQFLDYMKLRIAPMQGSLALEVTVEDIAQPPAERSGIDLKEQMNRVDAVWPQLFLSDMPDSISIAGQPVTRPKENPQAFLDEICLAIAGTFDGRDKLDCIRPVLQGYAVQGDDIFQQVQRLKDIEIENYVVYHPTGAYPEMKMQ